MDASNKPFGGCQHCGHEPKLSRQVSDVFSCDDYRQWWKDLFEYEDRTHKDYNITHLPGVQIVEKARREGYIVRFEVTEAPKEENHERG